MAQRGKNFATSVSQYKILEKENQEICYTFSNYTPPARYLPTINEI